MASATVHANRKTNYARIGQAAQNELPNILRELLLIKEPPNLLQSHVMQNDDLKRRLRDGDKLKIQQVANNNGYNGFDIPLMYTLIRNLKLVPQPTQGWDKNDPTPVELTVGDDVERIRRLRNEILHRGDADVHKDVLSVYMCRFKEIAGRLETYLGKRKDEFVSQIESLETCCMDIETERTYLDNLKELISKEVQLKGEVADVQSDIRHLRRDFEVEILDKKKLKKKSYIRRETIKWKQGSFFGIGGDKSQCYQLYNYEMHSGEMIPVYIQDGYDIPETLNIDDGKLQFGINKGILFIVYHDKNLTPYQHRFIQNEIQKKTYATNESLKALTSGKIDFSWIVGDYLRDFKNFFI
ncbi:uncharacterized protein [Mytilus edulis]|uniref:uncharacterized protein n=1 Tax=Mytilus edulis TaxID=6550 RepID=UPI0039F119B0